MPDSKGTSECGDQLTVGASIERCNEHKKNIPKAWFTSKFLARIAFIATNFRNSVIWEKAKLGTPRWVLRRQSFFCCCLCRCCSGGRRSTAFQNVIFLKKSSVDHFMEPSKKILDSENMMMELQALNFSCLFKKLRDLKRSQVPAFHWRFWSTVARGWRRVLLIKKGSSWRCFSSILLICNSEIGQMAQNLLFALLGS